MQSFPGVARVSKMGEGLHGSRGILSKFKALLERNRLGELMVMNGHLTTGELRYALARQKSTRQNLGHILLEENLISRSDLYSVLAQQWAFRALAGATALIIAFSCMGTKSAKAGSIKDVPAQMSLVSTANSAFAPVSAYPAIFGAAEKRSGNLDPFTKWTTMFNRFERAMNQSSGKQVINDWKADLEPIKGQSIRNMAERVNTLINQVDYVEDNRNYGQSDYWATPVEFFNRGGDCEDYAIAKYVSLRALGVPEDRMRIAIVQDLQKDIPHAVLIVYAEDGGAMVLDNQNKRALNAASYDRYKPIFSINRTAWWLHTEPDTTRLASAQ
jgi:predicted transglutaminase-like cysteine proteinase